jgi:adenylyltransferase/sulfurtransferase
VLFTVQDIGKNKAEAAKKRLLLLNPLINIKTFSFQLRSDNALEALQSFDVVVDASDNFPTRYLVNDACVLLNKPLVFGSVLEYEGHVAVFNFFHNNTYSANYRDIFPVPPPHDAVPNCEEAGVLGVLPGIIGSMQANEVIKLLTGNGEALFNKLLLLSSLSMDISIIGIKNTGSRETINKLIDYEEFCNSPSHKKEILSMKEIPVQQLQELKQSGEDFQLIDVREEYEYETGNLNGELIPMSEIPQQHEKISKSKKVIIH